MEPKKREATGKLKECLDNITPESIAKAKAEMDLEEAAKESGQRHFPDEYNIWARPNYEARHAELAFKEGANWKQRHLWKDAQGDDLPSIGKEVIALQGRKVVFAHRPQKYAKTRNSNLDEERVIEEMCYDKGCWNMKGITYWLDAQLPEGIHYQS